MAVSNKQETSGELGERGRRPLKELHEQQYFRIRIDETEDKSEPERAYVGVNGVGYWMTRGDEHIVPEGVVNVLKEQTRTVYRFNERTKDHERREVPPYPYHVLGRAEKPN